MMNETTANTLLLFAPIGSGLLALLLIVVLTPFAHSLRLLDEPCARKKHTTAVPMVGGISIYLAVLATLLVIAPPEKLGWLIAAGSILVAVGFLDDVFELGVKTRFFAQFVATLVMLAGTNLWITAVGIDWFGLNSLGFFGLAFTLIAVVGLTNAFNMADGIDGLAAGHAMIGLILIGSTMWFVHGKVWHIEWLTMFFSACFAFWLVNMSLTPLKRVFLGDAGSLYLGFVVAWMLIYFSQEPVSKIEPVAALWCVAIPVWDTLVVMARRVKHGRSPFAPDRNHFHHLLVDMGLSARLALVVILGMSVLFGAFGIWMTYVISSLVSLFTYAALFLIFGYGMLHPSLEKKLAVKLRLIDEL
jgi:UDP-GlcNAc:undecaprenyl-phosphate GlcNAc-1-phosphate transferase